MFGPNVCRRAAECLVFLGLSLACVAESDTSAIADVLQLRGTWQIAGQTPPLLAGTGLPPGALVQAVGGRKSDFIVLVLLDGKRLVATCSTSPCDASVRVPDSYVSGDVTFKRMLDAVKFVLLDRRPEVANAYSSTSSRGFSANREELVVPFTPGKEIQLSKALGNLDGDYHLEITRVSDGSFVLSKEVSFDSTHGATVLLPSAGSYIITLADTLSNLVADLLVVAAPEGSAEVAAEKALLEARRVCAKWDGPEAESSAHLFVRSYLLAVSEKP